VTGAELYLGSSEDYPATYIDGQFEFVVQSHGLYQFRLLYGTEKPTNHPDGSAALEWYWVNRTTGERDLVKPLVLESAATVAGPYSADLSAQIDPGAKTISVTRSGNARFYRLSSGTALTISSIALRGNTVLLTYQ
jgi:hypothetical protein